MITALVALGIVSLLELMLWQWPLWRWRKTVALILVVPLALSSGLLMGEQLTIWSAVVVILSLYRIVNLLRVIESRSHVDFLGANGRRSSWLLIGLQLLILGLIDAQHYLRASNSWWLGMLLLSQYGCVVVLLLSTLRHLRTTSPPLISERSADRDLPTLTVAIPARNETDDLEACLRSLIDSDYPKLEILVLDDCSQVKRTPEIIRGFAHDGVRFISGQAPPERWLAKNYAYKQLAEAASGELLLFCGVDVRFQSETLRQLVAVLLKKNKRMISLVPHNELPDIHSPDALLVQPDRYAWELALPRRWLNRPPVLSTCWLVQSKLLKEAGGFEAVSHSISPESYFAKWAVTHDDGYSFLRSNPDIGLSCLKSIDEQRATAIRTRYPQLHRRPELASVVSLLELSWLVAPFGLLVAGILTRSVLLMVASGLNCLLLLVFYATIINFTYQKKAFVGCWLLPVAVIYDVVLLNRSMWRYEFNEVIWKDRNVCIPVMRSVPTLPKL